MILIDTEKVILAGKLNTLMAEMMVALRQLCTESTDGENTSLTYNDIEQKFFEGYEYTKEIMARGENPADAIKRIQEDVFGEKSGGNDAENVLRKAMAEQTTLSPSVFEKPKKKKKKKKKNKKDKKDSE